MTRAPLHRATDHYGSDASTESRLRAAGLCGALHCRSPGESWVLVASLRIITDSASSALCGAPHNAEFERSMRVKAGLTRARVSGMKTGAGRRKGEARALLRGGH